jgi:hypothetical protein
MFKSISLSNASGGRHGLRFEIAAVLVFKGVVLWALWFLVFRHDPAVPRPSVAKLFTPAHASAQSEKTHDIR